MRRNFDLERSLRERQREREDIASVAGGVIEIYGDVPVHGPGYALFDVDFPVRFIEIPTLSYGFHIADNQAIDARNLPDVKIKVKTITSTQTSPYYYVAATMLLIAHGPTTLWGTAQWALRGKALRYPLEAANAGLGG